MRLEVCCYTYRTMGGGASVASVALYMEWFLRTVAPLELTVSVEACFRSARPKRGLIELYDAFHRSLRALPTTRYSPKKASFSIRYESRATTDKEFDGASPTTLTVFGAALRELSTLVPTLLCGHRALGSMVDASELTRAFDAAIAELPSTDQALQRLIEELSVAKSARLAQLSRWDRLEIDWSDYHPGARKLLDDTFFWEVADDHAPHGNDTGADLLADYRTWREASRPGPTSVFLEGLWRRWGYGADAFGWKTQPLSTWTKDDELVIQVHLEAVVALAFAQIKLDGRCEPTCRNEALLAIRRELNPAVAAHFGWSIPEERVRRLKQLESVLERDGQPQANA